MENMKLVLKEKKENYQKSLQKLTLPVKNMRFLINATNKMRLFKSIKT